MYSDSPMSVPYKSSPQSYVQTQEPSTRTAGVKSVGLNSNNKMIGEVTLFSWFHIDEQIFVSCESVSSFAIVSFFNFILHLIR